MRTLEQILGPLTPVWDECEPRTRKLTDRPGDQIFLIPHHSVSRTLGSIEQSFFSPFRSVSATSGCGPDYAGQDAYYAKQYVPWNTHRPYTTSSWVDDQAITFEMANLELSYPYPVGSTGKRWVAELAAAMHVELGMPLDRWHVACHSEIYERGWESYPTQCCGEDLRRALDEIVIWARIIVAESSFTPTPAPQENEDNMPKNSGISWKRADGAYQFMIFNTESGFLVEHSHTGGAYNSPLAAAFDTPNWAEVSEAHANIIRTQLVAVQKSKASGTLVIDIPEPVQVDEVDLV